MNYYVILKNNQGMLIQLPLLHYGKGVNRFTIPIDVYFGEGSLEVLKS